MQAYVSETFRNSAVFFPCCADSRSDLWRNKLSYEIRRQVKGRRTERKCPETDCKTGWRNAVPVTAGGCACAWGILTERGELGLAVQRGGSHDSEMERHTSVVAGPRVYKKDRDSWKP